MEAISVPPHLAEYYDVQPQAILWLSPVWDPARRQIVDFAYAYANEEGLRYLNIDRASLHNLYLSNSPTLTDAMREAVLQELATVYTTGQNSHTNLYNPALQKYARVIRTRLHDGVLSIVQDRTEEKRIIQQLEEQNRLLDGILQHSSNGITVAQAIRDAEGRIADFRTLIANEAATELTCVPRARLLSETFSELDPGFTASAYFRLCVQCVEEQKAFISQYYLAVADRWLEISVSPMSEDRQIYIFTDVTSIREAQLVTEHSVEKLHAVIDSTQTGFVMAAPLYDEAGQLTDFRFTMVNAIMAAFTGQKPSDLIGGTGSYWFARYKDNGLFERFRQAFESGLRQQFDFHYVGRDAEAWVNIMTARIGDELLCSVTDFTQVKQLQLELESMVNELRRSNASLEEFAYAASHDLKEPIRKINVFIERLKASMQAGLSTEQQQLIGRIERSTERMRMLVDDLLTYSYVSLTEHEKEWVDLNEKLKRVLHDLELAIEEKKAVIEVGTLPKICGYRRQLQQLFLNLLSNALKYSKPDEVPHISIQAQTVPGIRYADRLAPELQSRNYHLLQVADNGIGFEQQYAERIFGMFQRLHGKVEYSGTGIGLSIVKKVVENHRGQIWAEGEPGAGARFFILLPKEP